MRLNREPQQQAPRTRVEAAKPGEEETLDMSNTGVSRADRRAQHDQLRSSDAVDTVPLTEGTPFSS